MTVLQRLAAGVRPEFPVTGLTCRERRHTVAVVVTPGRRRILIVDDEPLITEVLGEHFRTHHDVELAHNGGEALAAVLRERPDLVLLDINMPRMNGIEVLKDIKRIDDTIPVVMVTANEQIALAGEALKAGAFGYVPKPFDFRYLDHMVATIFAPRRGARR
jgi:DNA-binding NtrC family response regulator